MQDRNKHLPRWLRGLSARLLVLTMVFVMLREVLIYVPSIARFRRMFLEIRVAGAHLASLALRTTLDSVISRPLELLANATAQLVSDRLGMWRIRPCARSPRV